MAEPGFEPATCHQSASQFPTLPGAFTLNNNSFALLFIPVILEFYWLLFISLQIKQLSLMGIHQIVHSFSFCLFLSFKLPFLAVGFLVDDVAPK